jgi:hypothetical protein
MPQGPRPARFRITAAIVAAAAVVPASAEAPSGRASSEFWRHWGDGRAEISAYRIVTPRYGEPREGTAVLIYVTEDMDRRSWIKDDRGDVPAEFRVPVLKLNRTLAFRTGIYPYSVMTSAFAPVDGGSPERFAPAKVSFSAQEWCGHVFELLWPEADRFRHELHSYFQAEGDLAETVDIGPGTLYEDVLFIQIRELDGPFLGGGDWSGPLVPSLWSRRTAHEPLRPVPARLARGEAERDGTPVTRFTLSWEGKTRTFDVERAAPRRILAWSGPDGEQAVLLRTARLPYWKLNRPGDESYLRELGLEPATGGTSSPGATPGP